MSRSAGPYEQGPGGRPEGRMLIREAGLCADAGARKKEKGGDP